MSTMIPVLERIVATYPIDTMQEGDLYMMNDPYLGGTHLPDIGIVMPIFAAGELVAFSSSMTHHQDIGGMAPGSVPTNATSIYQEGLRLPPLKLRTAGVFDEGLIRLLKLNSRIPETFIGDIHAQISSCAVGAARIRQLSDVYGPKTTMAFFETLLDRSEAMTREALRRIPPGTYRYVDYNDNDGLDLDQRIRIEGAVTPDGGNFHCDFTGTNAQVRGPFNVVRSGTQAAAYFVVRAICGDEIPTNGGCFRPVSISIPPGSILDPVEPAPVNARSATIKRVTGAMLGALREVLPDVIGADAAGEMLALMFGGSHRNGKPYVVGELVAGGSGAGPQSDGVDVIETDATNCMNLPVEALEQDAPIRMHQCALRSDSGGPGRFRGGLGVVRDYEILDGEVTFTHRGERHFVAARGAFGGQDGAMARTVIVRADGTTEVVPSKLVTQLRAGDRVIVETAGGGGFGAPRERDADSVTRDVANGKISKATARDAYGWQGTADG